MAPKTAKEFDPAVLKLFDKYVHGDISRRDFLSGVSKYAVAAGMTAAGMLGALSPQFAAAQKISSNDKRLKTSYIEFPSPKGYGKVRAYVAQPPNTTGKLPTILVVHENRGLNPHVEDITRRLALEGYIAMAPDALFVLGGYPGDEDKARELFAKLDQTKTREDFIAAADYLKKLPQGSGKVGVVGFCYGGGIANFLATRVADLAAAVPFYGMAPATEDVKNIKAPLLLHFAGNDDRINASWPAYETALKSAHVQYEAHIYPGVEHGFNNDTTPRYDEAAAKLAWSRTLEFFGKHLH